MGFGSNAATVASTPAAAVVSQPRVSTVAADGITRRADDTRISLGSSPSTPQQTMRATLLGKSGG